MNISFFPRLLLLLSSAFLLSACATSPVANLTQTDVRLGSGAEAIAGKQLTVHYTGWLYDESVPDHRGQQFDSSRKGRPFSFQLGTGNVIKGWDRGLVGMKVGGQRTLVIPPDLGYGHKGAGKRIPRNSALVFDVELLDVR